MTTATDLFLWNEALKNNTVLSADAREKFEHPWVQEGPKADTYYGYGWATATTERDTKLVAHNGGNDIFFADFRRYVDEDITIIYFTNQARTYFLNYKNYWSTRCGWLSGEVEKASASS